MSSEVQYRGRRAVQIENDRVRVTVLTEGGHIAEILDKASGVNPLWTPPWPSLEPSTYTRDEHPEYGNDSESKLLAGIMGHNLCLDLFGPPSADEAEAGLTVHGEASIAAYDIAVQGVELMAKCTLTEARLAFERRIALDGCRLNIQETVENLSACDRPIAWTQHVTLGPPFVEQGSTVFRAPATHSYCLAGNIELQRFTAEETSGGFATYLMDPSKESAWFLAYSPGLKVLLRYVWRRSDYPWLGIWEENRSRTQPPWNGQTITRGLEFGASPLPEPRHVMIGRGKLFDTPCYRWIPARRSIQTSYTADILSGPEAAAQFESTPA